MAEEGLIWFGIALCLSQSAMFSGLNLAFFNISRLRLEAEAQHNPRAKVVLALRRDANFLLTTILWGNVAVNTLLALLSNSVMSGVMAFVFSTVLITFIGEICPQAYFSRRALAVAARLAPLLRMYQVLLWPVARPSARMLDLWLGRESIEYLKEKTLRQMILSHVQQGDAEIAPLEGRGALNFIDLDDQLAKDKGQRINPASMIALPQMRDEADLPHCAVTDPLMRQIAASGMKWVILTGILGQPVFVLDANRLLRDAVFAVRPLALASYCHRPLIIRDAQLPFGEVMAHMNERRVEQGAVTIDKDVALIWDPADRRVITGADILAELLRGLRRQA